MKKSIVAIAVASLALSMTVSANQETINSNQTFETAKIDVDTSENKVYINKGLRFHYDKKVDMSRYYTQTEEGKVALIKVAIYPGQTLPAEWEKAVRYAPNYINKHAKLNNSSVRFKYVTSGTAGVYVAYEDMCHIQKEMPSDSTIAETSLPMAEDTNMRQVGFMLCINPNLRQSYKNLLTLGGKIGVIQHELLHAVGFGHAGTDEGSKIPGTSNKTEWKYEDYSIMTGKPGTDNLPYFMNFIDGRALGQIYPKPKN